MLTFKSNVSLLQHPVPTFIPRSHTNECTLLNNIMHSFCVYLCIVWCLLFLFFLLSNMCQIHHFKPPMSLSCHGGICVDTMLHYKDYCGIVKHDGFEVLVVCSLLSSLFWCCFLSLACPQCIGALWRFFHYEAFKENVEVIWDFSLKSYVSYGVLFLFSILRPTIRIIATWLMPCDKK